MGLVNGGLQKAPIRPKGPFRGNLCSARVAVRRRGISGRLYRGETERGVFACACQYMYALSLCAPGPKCCILEASFSLLKHDQSARDNRLPVQRRRLRSLRHRLVISVATQLFAYPLFKPTRELVPIGGWALKRLQSPKRPDLS